MSAHILEITDAQFDSEVIGSDLPVIVDFWAPWCGPCKAIAPTLEEVAQEMAGKIKVVKVNVDDNPDTPAKHGVRGIPTLFLVKDGLIEDRKVGVMSKAQILEWIAQSPES